MDGDDAIRYAEALGESIGADDVAIGRPDHWYAPIRVARFRLGGTTFVLVPGGTARLGHAGVLAPLLTPPRTVEMPALLVAADTVTAGLTEVSPEHPLVVEHLAAHQHSQPGRSCLGDLAASDEDEGTYVRIEVGPAGGTWRCWTAAYVTFDQVVADLAGAGHRLLTPDEWEYAMGLGPGTLFPWGDDPDDRETAETVTGLRPGDPSWPELTSVHGEVRGTDLGESACGGANLAAAQLADDRLADALLCAPAFRDPEIVADESGRPGVRRRRYRAAFEVPPLPVGA